MNHQQLAQRISHQLYLRLSLSKKTLDLISSEIAKELRAGERVYLRNLGAFHSVNRPAKRYYDIKTKKIKIKPAHKDVIFRPGKHLLRQIVALPIGRQTTAFWPARAKKSHPRD